MSGLDAKTLVLLRHATAGWPGGVDDHDRPLAERGHRQAPGAGEWLLEHGIVPEAAVVSDALRTRQTWVWVAERLGDCAASRELRRAVDDVAALAPVG